MVHEGLLWPLRGLVLMLTRDTLKSQGRFKMLFVPVQAVHEGIRTDGRYPLDRRKLQVKVGRVLPLYNVIKGLFKWGGLWLYMVYNPVTVCKALV